MYNHLPNEIKNYIILGHYIKRARTKLPLNYVHQKTADEVDLLELYIT